MTQGKEKKSPIFKGIAIGCGSLLGLFIIIGIIAAIFGSGTPNFDKVKSPTNQSPITLSARYAYKNAKIDLYQNGTKTQELKSDNKGSFTAKVDLTEGDNKFKATATNDKGKTRTSLEINVFYDKTPPTISLIQPQSPTENEKIEIQGESEKNAEIKLLNNGKEVAKLNTKDVKFTFKNVGLTEGENKFKAVALDGAGNQGESQEVVIVFNDPRPAEAKRKAEQEAAEKARQEAEARAKAEAEAKKWQPIDLSGYGQQATDKFTLQSGLSIFKMNHTGSGNFAIWLIDSNGDKVELLVNEIGVFDGSKAVGIVSTGNYLLDVTASSNWSVNITQPR